MSSQVFGLRVGRDGFIMGADMMVDNAQTRLLANLESGHEIPFGECNEALLTSAKQHLQEKIAVVGLTEQFDQTLFLLQKSLGWSSIHYVQQNVSPNRATGRQLSPVCQR